MKALARTFKNLSDTRIFIFEDFPKWLREFDSVAYMTIKDSDVKDTEHVIDLGDYFLKHGKSYVVTNPNINQFLKDNKHGFSLWRLRILTEPPSLSIA